VRYTQPTPTEASLMIPPKTILVAVDFSEGSLAALRATALLAAHTKAEVRVLHVEDPLLAAAASERGFHLASETREELDRLIARVPEAEALAPQRYVVTGRPVEVVLDAACREGADLIVVASHGMSGAARAFFGSVTEGLLHRTDRSLLVVPAEWSLPSGRTGIRRLGPIVVGLEFSSAATAALQAGCRLAEAFQTSVEVVHVVPNLPVLERWRPHADAAIAERTDLARREVARIAGAIGTDVLLTQRIEQGAVADRLAEIAVPWGDRQPLMVLGKRSADRGGAPGAIAYRVVTLARAPVLMHIG
jgi:nucleotide-binding universal stress UspA family protein